MYTITNSNKELCRRLVRQKYVEIQPIRQK